MTAAGAFDARRGALGRLARAGCCLLLSAACGCTAELPTYYGRHRIPTVDASVNGTDALAGMFRDAGHQVYYRNTLVTGELDAADTVVWFPNDFAAPREEACDWFDNWLFEKPGRAVIYVGRDYSAAPLYWKLMAPLAGEDQKQAYADRALDARLDSVPPEIAADKLECQWFHFERNKKPVDIEALSGPWAEGIDAAAAHLQWRTRLVPSDAPDWPLASGDDPLVARFSRRYWVGGRVLLVTNGSFLLNLPLVNHQNRKLAARLIESLGEPGRVVFLESGPGGPPIDPPYAGNSLWQLLGAWPLNVILLQLALAGVMFCFARWPIFGRPRQPPDPSASDFAKHVDAVGRLLARTKDRAFAQARLAAEAAPDGRNDRLGRAAQPLSSKTSKGP